MTVGNAKIARSFVWKLLEKGSLQVVAFLVTLVLARILSPQEYGIVSLVLVFTSIAIVFVQGGFNTALIQRKGATQEDFSTVLFLSLIISMVLYALLFAIAPLIATLYNEDSLVGVTRVISLMLIFGAFNSVQVAYATKKFMFKSLFVSNFSAVIVSAVIGIGLALNEYGVWALVAQQLGNQAFACIVMWFTVRWRPAKTFSLQSVKDLFAFGGNVLAGNLLVSLFLNVRSLLIGVIADTATLGLFNRGRQFPTAIMEAINGSLQEVMLPAFSDMQDDVEEVRNTVRRSIKISTFIVFPLMLGLAAIAEPLVNLLLTEKWLACVPFLQVFCISYLFNPTQTISAQALRGIGNSSSTLKLEVARKIAEAILLLVSVPFGAMALAVSSVVAGLVGCLATVLANAKWLGYKGVDQLKDVMFPLMAGFVMACCMYAIGFFIEESWLAVVVECLTGITVYLCLAVVLKSEAIRDLLRFVPGLR